MPAGNHGLHRFGGPARPGNFPWSSRINASGTLANRPAACSYNKGFTYFATDVNGGTVYRSDGSSWSQVSFGISGPVFAASGTNHAVGLVPDPGSSAGSTKFLREDATWAVPAGSSATNPLLQSWNIKATAPTNTSVAIAPGPFWSNYEAILEDGSANTLKVNSSSTITISGGSTGANGLDTGSLANNTWYYFYIINNGTTTAGLLSTSASAPTMPSGYTYKCLIGAVRTQGAATWNGFTQLNGQVWIIPLNVFTNFAMTSSNTYQSQSISTIVPPLAVACSGLMGSSVSGNAPVMEVAGDSNGIGERKFYLGISPGTAASESYFGVVPFADCPIITSQTIYVAAPNTNAANRMDISGWRYY